MPDLAASHLLQAQRLVAAAGPVCHSTLGDNSWTLSALHRDSEPS